jgi:hypothetical protein
MGTFPPVDVAADIVVSIIRGAFEYLGYEVEVEK